MNAFSCAVLRAVVRHTAWQYWKGVDQCPVSGLRRQETRSEMYPNRRPDCARRPERAEHVMLERCCWFGHNVAQPSSQPSSTPHLLRPRYTERMCFSGSFSGFRQHDTQFSYWLQHWSSAPHLRAGWGGWWWNGWGAAAHGLKTIGPQLLQAQSSWTGSS